MRTLLNGCKCVTGCVTKRCYRRKNGKICPEGCKCINCYNTQDVELVENDELESVSIDEDMAATQSDNEEFEDFLDWIIEDTEEITSEQHCTVDGGMDDNIQSEEDEYNI